MKLKYIYIFLIPVLAAVLIFSAFTGNEEHQDKKGNETIIKFSHEFHSDLAECADCHAAVIESTKLSDRMMPDHESCGTCHDVEDDENCGTCHYEDVFEPLIQNTGDMLFNHKFHMTDKEMSCETCHKGFKEVNYGSELANPDPIMADCYSCHNDTEIASNACESCHTSTVDLLPQSHKSTSFIKAHKFAANDFNADCIMCHDSNTNSCVDCHIASKVIVGDNNPDEFYAPYAANNFLDGAKKQKLNRVHELNYRFTHGMDAKGKTSDCQSCHQTETFCGSCHQGSDNDFAMGGIMPASHIKPGFFTIGAGSGGGEHAKLARRDIESCIACHDVQGADPTCITCHLDSDGIKGTNPKTHPANFMRNENGDWHSSLGSVCYNCHVNASPSTPAGIGFCGYCHGAN